MVDQINGGKLHYAPSQRRYHSLPWQQLAHSLELVHCCLTEFRQPLQVQSHLEMTGILVQLGHIQRT